MCAVYSQGSTFSTNKKTLYNTKLKNQCVQHISSCYAEDLQIHLSNVMQKTSTQSYNKYGFQIHTEDYKQEVNRKS